MINRELIRLKVVQLVYAYYQNEGKAMDVAEKEFSYSLSKAYDLYKYLLSLLVDIRRYAERKAEAAEAAAERTGNKLSGIVPNKQLADNKFLLILSENEQLEDYRDKKGVWDDEVTFIKKLYNNILDSDIFQLYLENEDFGFEADREVVRKIYKNFVCNNDDLDALLEDHSLYWNDDKEIVDSFVLKTIKRFTAESTPKQELLPEYASTDDHDYAVALFRESINKEEEVRTLIQENCKNWEFNRLAFMDVIIMQIALAEILTFPTIPVNVSFNEYLDLAKIYSTPRSASYINGLLDYIVKKLKEEHKLLKD